MTQEQAMRDPRRNVLLQCVGASAEVKPEYRTGAMKNGMSVEEIAGQLHVEVED